MVVSQAARQDIKRAPLAQPEVAGQGRSIAWWGVLAMIASEVIFFANLIIGYLYLRVRAGQWPPEGIEPLKLLLPTINTAILLSSALPMHGAHLAIRRGDRQGMKTGLILASILGAIFISGQAMGVHARPLLAQERHVRLDLLHADRLPRPPCGRRHYPHDDLLHPCPTRQFHPRASFRRRSRRDVLALRRCRLGDPLRRPLPPLTGEATPRPPPATREGEPM